jgi:hypothetical protein
MIVECNQKAASEKNPMNYRCEYRRSVPFTANLTLIIVRSKIAKKQQIQAIDERLEREAGNETLPTDEIKIC